MRVNLEARAANAERRRSQTRDRLIEAALAVIAEKGPDAASVEDFVSAAGVSRGTFYNYFPTTDELILALYLRLGEAYDRELEAVTVGVRDPALILALIVHQAFKMGVQDPVRAWVSMRIEGTSTPRQERAVARFDALYQHGVSRKRFREVDLEAARSLLFGAGRMAQSEIIAGRSGLAHTVPLIALALCAFGLERDEAEALSGEAFRTIHG